MSSAENVCRVLLVDDDERLLRVLARGLRQAGLDVAVASDGPAALAELHAAARSGAEGGAATFDVVVSDVGMPGMSGVELLRAVRQIDTELPVILCTGAPSLETATGALEHGALQYFAKPVAIEVLAQAIARAHERYADAKRKSEALRVVTEMRAKTGEQLTLQGAFDRMLGGMWMAYQPIVSPERQDVFGNEALLRSREPALPHPGAVLGAAERLGRLRDLGRRARALAAAGFDAAPPGTLLFVNLHSQDLDDVDLLANDSALTRIADRVVLEITERAAVADDAETMARIRALRQVGFRIAIDDLGEGYAGLTSLARIEPEFVKLDMSLVRDIGGSVVRQHIVGAVASLCAEIGMHLIGEGVETREERDVLLDLGCGLQQGYLFAKPGAGFPPVEFPKPRTRPRG